MTPDGLTTRADLDAATDSLDRIEENARFHTDSLTGDAFATAQAAFRQYERFPFVDACIVACMQTEGLCYLYAFDDVLVASGGLYHLDTATDPYRPE